ncbi:hypothetical protein TNCT_606881 [Trichonephila clavata]|uniref:Uncharacterized protein n=1 Tax=Trichonephila clavata TaxID=2740835 RepID=A0A8X6LD92_TRICU|nr:hypothetical protein TNCT_606881 [Trichonephila clavata]
MTSTIEGGRKLPLPTLKCFPYSLDLEPSNYKLSGPLKEILKRERISMNVLTEREKGRMHNWHRTYPQVEKFRVNTFGEDSDFDV